MSFFPVHLGDSICPMLVPSPVPITIAMIRGSSHLCFRAQICAIYHVLSRHALHQSLHWLSRHVMRQFSLWSSTDWIGCCQPFHCSSCLTYIQPSLSVDVLVRQHHPSIGIIGKEMHLLCCLSHMSIAWCDS